MRSLLSLSLLSASYHFGLAHVHGHVQARSESNGITAGSVQVGGKCGIGGGNAVCAAGLCCGIDNTCGTGGDFCTAPDCQLDFGPGCDGNKKPTGADTSNVPRPLFGSLPYGASITDCTVSGKVALTFDDGPYIWTGELLDLLKSNGVKATFFVVGFNGGKGMINDPASGYGPFIQRMISEGHQIGSHSWSHQDFGNITNPTIRMNEILWNEIAIADLIGAIPTYFRPPYTNWNQEALDAWKKYGYHVFNYNLDTLDWEGDYNYAQNIYTSTLSSHSPSSASFVTLAHDIQDKTVHGFAQFMIDNAKKLGYELVTAGECMGDPIQNWYRDLSTGGPWNPASGGSKPTTTPTANVTSMSASMTPTTTATPKAVSVGNFNPGTNTSKTGSNDSGNQAPTTSSTSSPSSAPKSATGTRPFISIFLLISALVFGLLV